MFGYVSGVPATDSWTKFPAELVPVLKMLPRHADVPYESILLRPSEKSALMGHLREALADMEPSMLRDIYHQLSIQDRDMAGCLSFNMVKMAFEQREAKVRVTHLHFPYIFTGFLTLN